MTQHFFRGQRVKVADEMPRSMSHFDKGFEGIIVGSYTDQYMRTEGGRSDHQFTLLRLEDGKPVNRISWYHDDQLTLLSDDRAAGEKLIYEYAHR